MKNINQKNLLRLSFFFFKASEPHQQLSHDNLRKERKPQRSRRRGGAGRRGERDQKDRRVCAVCVCVRAFLYTRGTVN